MTLQHPAIQQIFLHPAQIQRRVEELGAQISEDYTEKDLALVCVLRGAVVFVSDLEPERVRRAVQEHGAIAVSDQQLLHMEADIFAPCALGAVLNDDTIPRLKVRAVAGAANNQLAEPRHGEMLVQKGIVYAPDYAINAGGLINVAQEWIGYDRSAAMARADKIYHTVDSLLERSKQTGERPEVVADRMVEEILQR